VQPPAELHGRRKTDEKIEKGKIEYGPEQYRIAGSENRNVKNPPATLWPRNSRGTGFSEI